MRSAEAAAVAAEETAVRSVEATADEQQSDAGVAESTLVQNSITGSVWTLVSRVSGLVRVVVVGAVLGATFLGNTYQAVNMLPNLIYYQLLAGSLFVSLLVPALVSHIRDGDRSRAESLVRGFLGSILALAFLCTCVLVVAAPLILDLLSVGVADDEAAADQQRVGLLLLVLFAPQVLFYVVAGTGAAVMNAHGRFGLAAAAPAVENVVIIATLVLAAVIFGSDVGISTVSTEELLLLGIGTTTGVAIHAALQWFGARRDHVTMYPRAGWRDPEVRVLLGRIRAVLSFTVLEALLLVTTIIVANRVAGGLVAFQLALNFFYLPAAIVTWPVARALVPRLADSHQTGRMRDFRDDFLRAIALASFVAVPVAVTYAVSAPAIADVVAFGRLDTEAGTSYIAASILALSPAVIAELWFTLGSYALYSQQNVAAPLRAMLLRFAVTLLLMIPALAAHGARSLMLIGFAMAGGTSVGAAYVWRQATRKLPRTDYSLAGSLGRTAIASAAMLLPAGWAWMASSGLPESHLGAAVRLSIAGLVGAVAFVAVQAWLRAPELRLIRASLPRTPAPRQAGR
jgi:putative peptidoglycan lipid II flippase